MVGGEREEVRLLAHAHPPGARQPASAVALSIHSDAPERPTALPGRLTRYSTSPVLASEKTSGHT